MTIGLAAILMVCGVFTLGRRWADEDMPTLPLITIFIAVALIASELMPASVDRSGEAGETPLGGSTVGESAARSEAKGDAR